MMISRYLSSCIGSVLRSARKPAVYSINVPFKLSSDGIISNEFTYFSIKSDSKESAIRAAVSLLSELTLNGDIESVGKVVEVSEIPHCRVWDAEISGNKIGRMGEIF